MLIRALLTVLILVAPPMAAQVAPRWKDSSEKAVIRGFRTSRIDVPALLRGKDGALAPRLRDAIGDSLVSIALEARRPTTSDTLRQAMIAIDALGNAGARRARAVRVNGGGFVLMLEGASSYAGALERLMKIYRAADNPQIKLAVVQSLFNAGQLSETVRLLSEIAVSPSTESSFAMNELTARMDPNTNSYQTATTAEREAARRAIRTLWDAYLKRSTESKNVPQNSDALRVLKVAAGKQGWLPGN